MEGLGRALAGLGAHHRHEVLLVREDEGYLLLQEVVVQKVARAESDPGDLVLVGGSDALLGGADDVLPAVLLLGAVELLVIVHDEVRTVGDAEAVDVAPGLLDLLDLLCELLQVDDHSVADDGELARTDDARGQSVKLEHLAVHDDRMAGVVASLEADDHVGVLAEVIRDLSFSFVSPLRSDDG